MFKKKSFENNLKTLQEHIDPHVGYLLSSEISIDLKDILFLKAKNLVTTSRGYDDEYKIALTPEGITYFSDKADLIKRSILNWSINFAVAISSAIAGSVITLIVDHLWIR